MPRNTETHVPLDKIEAAREKLAELDPVNPTAAKITAGEMMDGYGLRGAPGTPRTCRCPVPRPVREADEWIDGQRIVEVRCQKCGHGRPEWDR